MVRLTTETRLEITARQIMDRVQFGGWNPAPPGSITLIEGVGRATEILCGALAAEKLLSSEFDIEPRVWAEEPLPGGIGVDMAPCRIDFPFSHFDLVRDLLDDVTGEHDDLIVTAMGSDWARWISEVEVDRFIHLLRERVPVPRKSTIIQLPPASAWQYPGTSLGGNYVESQAGKWPCCVEVVRVQEDGKATVLCRDPKSDYLLKPIHEIAIDVDA